MAAAPIDLSAGLVPKSGPIDISAGLVPKDQPDTRSLLQKAQDKFDQLTTVTPEQEAGHGKIVNTLQKFGAGAIQGLGSPIVHPVQTVEGVGKLGSALLGNEQDATDIVNGFKNQSVAQGAGNLVGGALLGEAVAPAIAPVANAVKTGAGKALLLGKTPEAAYESALKPSTTLSQTERAAAVKTGLDNELPVSKGGLESLGELINDYNQKIKDVIAQDPTRPIDPNAVATRADLAKAKFAQQVNAGGDLKAIDASKQQFLEEQGAYTPAKGPQGQAPPMNAADAQAMKQGTYQVLRGKFGEQGSAAVEAQKALARGLKEEIANQFPEIANLNANESRLLNLEPILERAVNRISNHQLIGIGTPVAGAAAKAVTGSAGIGVIASTIKGVLDNPFVKSKLAIAVSKGAKIPIGQAAARVQAYSAALGASAAASTAAASQDSSVDQTDSK